MNKCIKCFFGDYCKDCDPSFQKFVDKNIDFEKLIKYEKEIKKLINKIEGVKC